MTLVYGKEKLLFSMLLLLSSLFWLALLLGTVGLVLVWVLMFFLFYLFAQSAFISYLKGTAVLITAQQFPDLHQRITACAAKLGMKEIPDAYLMHGNGVFNAFATRFLGRNFMVLLSDVVDALDERPESLNFYIGHELGHIKRDHLLWAPVLFPAGMLPLIGAAYSRAREYTCDRHGLVCCAGTEDACSGMAALAAGGKRWKTLNQKDYIGQSQSSSDFWMSLHELLGDYPWLVKRMAAIQALGSNQKLKQPRRNFFAYLFAMFIPRLGLGAGGGAASVLIMVAIIGILAAIALPAYQDYGNKAKVVGAAMTADPAKAAVLNYVSKNGTWPNSNADVGLAESGTLHVGREGVITVSVVTGNQTSGNLVYTPSIKDQRIDWQCAGEGLMPKYLPAGCK